MRRALALAGRGDFRVGRNPRVGAVVARGDEVLAEGYHAVSGGPHAEAAAFAALDAAGEDARGATLYVTLEPCGDFPGKRTPACVEALLARGLARVVVATGDPSHGGAPLARLRAAGVEVETGLCGAEARRLNGPFLKACAGSGLPYLTAKWAMSLDGKIACRTGHSRWISGEAARLEVHRLRGEVDAVLVGVGTALADDPALTRRGVEGGDPLRVVLDARARLPLDGQLARTARETPLLVAVTAAAPAERRAALAERGAEVLVLPTREGTVDAAALLRELGARGQRHVLVEGGGGLLASLFAQDLVDRVQVYIAPRILGGREAPGPVGGEGAATVPEGPALESLVARAVGEDVLLEGHLRVHGEVTPSPP